MVDGERDQGSHCGAALWWGSEWNAPLGMQLVGPIMSIYFYPRTGSLSPITSQWIYELQKDLYSSYTRSMAFEVS